MTGRQITERLSLKDWPKNVWYVTHSPDAKTLAVGADDMTVWLYDATADKPKEKNVLRVEKTALGIKELFFTPDGKRLILGTGAGAVRLWDVATREPKELAAKDGESDTFLLPMSLSPDGQVLAVARGKTVQLFDVTEDGFAEWMRLDKYTRGLRAVNFSPDGKLLASTGQDGQIVLWKVGLDKPILVKRRSGTFCFGLIEIGPPCEDQVLEMLESKRTFVIEEGLRILDRVGTSKSLPAMEKARNHKEQSVARLAKLAIMSVKECESSR